MHSMVCTIKRFTKRIFSILHSPMSSVTPPDYSLHSASTSGNHRAVDGTCSVRHPMATTMGYFTRGCRLQRCQV